MSVLYDDSNGPFNSQDTKVLTFMRSVYQDRLGYNWISPLNKQSGYLVILTQQSVGENKYGISSHLHIFAFLKHLMVLLRCNFLPGFILHLIKPLITCRDM